MDPQYLAIKDSALIVQPAATLAASANSAAFDIAQGAQLVNGQYAPGAGGAAMNMIVPVLSYSGTSPTATFAVQDSPDGTTWTTQSRAASLAGDNVPATGGIISIMFSSRARYVRLVTVIGGTSPSVVLGDCYLQPFTSRLGN